jgi:hypothetical protein
MWSNLPFDSPRTLRFGANSLLNTALEYMEVLAGPPMEHGDILFNAPSHPADPILVAHTPHLPFVGLGACGG